MVDLDELEASDAKRTPGEWHKAAALGVFGTVDGAVLHPIASMHCENTRKDEDATHVVAAVNAAPAMIAELRGLRAALRVISECACDGGWGGACGRANYCADVAFDALDATKKQGA